MRFLLTHRAVRRALGLVMLGLLAQAAPAQRPDAGVIALDGWEYRWGDSPLDERGRPTWTWSRSRTSSTLSVDSSGCATLVVMAEDTVRAHASDAEVAGSDLTEANAVAKPAADDRDAVSGGGAQSFY